MARIHLLDRQTAELIAAGEVIERPSSVVKELVENAIDSGATAITVEIQNGGVRFIRVTDNGCGILREDVPTAFLRHATSKVRAQEDLYQIGTLGFRGEALASICAVSRVELLTRTKGEPLGSRYEIAGGVEGRMEDAGCPVGTTILVRDLFYNVPARMKFLKKDSTEGNAIATLLDRLALSHPEIAFKFLREGQRKLQTPGDGSLLSAVHGVYGGDFSGGLIPVEGGSLEGRAELVEQVKDVMEPINRMDGDSLPVSSFVPHVDGTFQQGASAYEKRGVAVSVPAWNQDTCIQCNQCAYVCPHATIRPFALDAEEAKNAPECAKIVDFKAGKGKGLYQYSLAVSPMDCMGCSVCVGVCPTKSLSMVPLEQEAGRQPAFDYMVAKVTEKPEVTTTATVPGSQFKQPLLEFSGSCAGCAETAYARLVTQVCGDRMYVSNATGCSSIWGGPAATSPYTVNKDGKGVAWANSLFEDNAEHGLGIHLGQKAIRNALADKTRALIAVPHTVPELKEAAQKWLDTMDDGEANAEATKAYIAALEDGLMTVDEIVAFTSSPAAAKVFGDQLPQFQAHAKELKDSGAQFCDCDACKLAKEILDQKDYLNKKSVWIFGGDGWAYDIGYGGLDHVLASGEDVNIFVFDTEVYSNTGGQASKASNIGQVAQFAAAGKVMPKKSLTEIAMTYGYVYVAQVSMGANPNQTLKAIAEAEAYHGPSLIIGYAPCEMHSIKGGMMNCQKEMKKAVDCGYWNLLRFNPEGAPGKKLVIDSKEPAEGEYQNFLMNEARYSRLTREFPERAGELFAENERAAMDRWDHLQKLKDLYAAE